MVQKSILDNGIRVVTETMPGTHSATIGFWVLNGSRHEPAAFNGISHFIEHMLFKGTERRRAFDIAKEIDSVGGVLNAFTAREYTCFYAKVLAKKVPLAVDLLSDIVLNSVFDMDEIEKERRVILQEIHMVEDAPEDMVHDLFNQVFWKDHPLGQPIQGNWDTVQALSRPQILNFMAQRYCGRNIMITAAGNIDHQEMVDSLAEAFAGVPSGEEPVTSPLPDYGPGFAVEDRDIEQVHICLGFRGLPQNHPNRFEAYLLNGVLGGSMSCRLFQKIREEKGLAYSIYSYLDSHTDAGALGVYAATSPDDAAVVIRMVLAELKRLVDEPISEEELYSTREQLKGNLLLSLESTDSRMTRLAKNEIYVGKHLSFKDVLSGFEKVSRDGVQRLAQFLLRDDYLNLQLLGRIDPKDLPSVDLTLG